MKKILIADDSEINREILSEIFIEQFEVLHAADGEQAIELIGKEKENLSLIMLDLVMPKKDGMAVLDYIHKIELNDVIPVIMITGEATTESDIKAYEYGAADIIYKPFSRRVVTRRALNIIELYETRKDMEKQLEERTVELQYAMRKLAKEHERVLQNNDFLIKALGSVLELRSLESGVHIARVQVFTRILLKNWKLLHMDCKFTNEEIEQMVAASALHDIGKIAIPDEILCKPGRLTAEEYEIMKTHTTRGCELLEHFQLSESDFYNYCYDICNYHHERYDGGGYPFGLQGEQIPLWAQVVAIADVYDALVSPRIYKAPYSIDEAFRMIENGECGVFSPEIMECFENSKFEIIAATETESQTA